MRSWLGRAGMAAAVRTALGTGQRTGRQGAVGAERHSPCKHQDRPDVASQSEPLGKVREPTGSPS